MKKFFLFALLMSASQPGFSIACEDTNLAQISKSPKIYESFYSDEWWNRGKAIRRDTLVLGCYTEPKNLVSAETWQRILKKNRLSVGSFQEVGLDIPFKAGEKIHAYCTGKRELLTSLVKATEFKVLEPKGKHPQGFAILVLNKDFPADCSGYILSGSKLPKQHWQTASYTEQEQQQVRKFILQNVASISDLKLVKTVSKGRHYFWVGLWYRKPNGDAGVMSKILTIDDDRVSELKTLAGGLMRPVFDVTGDHFPEAHVVYDSPAPIEVVYSLKPKN